MDSNKSGNLQLIYEGSVKRLWQCPTDAERIWFEFTDDYSIFDWGKMPDTIENKGRALSFMGAHFFEVLSSADFWTALPESKHLKRFGGDWLRHRFEHPVYAQGLSKRGLDHHFLGLSDGKKPVSTKSLGTAGSAYMEVKKAEIPNPELKQVLNHELYFYPHIDSQGKRYERRLVPLEVVFRFGMPEGSSLTSRIDKNPEYLKDLGLPAVPSTGEWFPVPVIEFFTKLEPSDRLLSWTEASLVSGLSGQLFQALCELTLEAALALYHIFADKGLALWDGKFEFVVEYGKNGEARLLLADSIGPDELRLLYNGHHLSKELIRQIYKKTSWCDALAKAKTLAKSRLNADFKEICKTELHQSPQPMSPQEKNVVDKLYGVLANHLAGEEVFANHPGLDELVDLIDQILDTKAGVDAKVEHRKMVRKGKFQHRQNNQIVES